MFVNISNHPSQKWEEVQKVSAGVLGGKIIDVPFPQVDPCGDGQAELSALLDVCADLFCSATPNEQVTLYIAGEAWLTYEFLCHVWDVAKGCGIDTAECTGRFAVVFACSDRISTENADGTKTVGFQFRQWRFSYGHLHGAVGFESTTGHGGRNETVRPIIAGNMSPAKIEAYRQRAAMLDAEAAENAEKEAALKARLDAWSRVPLPRGLEIRGAQVFTAEGEFVAFLSRLEPGDIDGLMAEIEENMSI